MSTEVKFRRGTTTEMDAFTGAAGEMTLDTDKDRLIVQDGARAGGFPVPNFDDVQAQRVVHAAASGTNTLTCALVPAAIAYVDGMRVSFKAANNNTDSVTLNVNGLGAKTLKKNGGADNLVADDIVAGQIVAVVYDGTNFQITSSSGGGGSFTEEFISADQTITSSGSLTLAHGLSAKPKLVQLWLKNTSAEFGYSVDDELLITPHPGSDTNSGISIVPDGTNLNIRFGNSAVTFNNIHKTSAGGAALTNSRWKAIFRAWV